MLSTHRNALIYGRNFFWLTVKTRPSSRQNFALMISTEKSRDSKFARFRQLSPTIGQFFALSIAERIPREDEKKRPSASIAQGVRTGDVCILLITRTRPQSLARLFARHFNEAEARAPRMQPPYKPLDTKAISARFRPVARNGRRSLPVST